MTWQAWQPFSYEACNMVDRTTTTTTTDRHKLAKNSLTQKSDLPDRYNFVNSLSNKLDSNKIRI